MSVVCRICLDIAAKDSHSRYYSLNDATDPCAMMIKWKLEKCLPEIAVDAIKDSVICNSCTDALHVAYKFRKKFMETEEKLRKYMMEENSDDNDSIDISLLLKWLSKYDAYKKPSCTGHKRDKKNMNDCYMELIDIRTKTHKLTSDESDIAPLVVNIKSEPINESCTSPIAYNSALDQLRVEVDWNDKDAPKSPDCNPANQFYKSEGSTLEELLKGPISDVCISSDQYIQTNALKSDLEKEPPDFNDDHDMKDISVKTEEPERLSNMIISGLSCDYKHFLEFEEQFAGYTMDELYSKQLIALPECTVVIDRLSNKEIKRWTEGESDEEQSEESNIPEETDPKRYKCYSCNYYAPQLEQFVEHMTNSIHQQKQKCFISKRRFTSSIIEESQDYWKSHLREAPVKCSLCQFTTDDDNKFKEHLEFHSLMYKCAECSYATTSTNNLQTHYIRTHCNTTTPFRCNKCKLFFSSRLKLINHMLTCCTKCKGDIYYEHNYAVM